MASDTPREGRVAFCRDYAPSGLQLFSTSTLPENARLLSEVARRVKAQVRTSGGPGHFR